MTQKTRLLTQSSLFAAATDQWAKTRGLIDVNGVPRTLLISNNLSDLTDLDQAQLNLGLRVGIEVQAWSTILDRYASSAYPSDLSLSLLGNETTQAWLTDLFGGPLPIELGGTRANNLDELLDAINIGNVVRTDPSMSSDVFLPAPAANQLISWNSTGSGLTNVSLGAYLSTAGGTMSGPITLSGLPTNSNHAASKFYIDNALATGNAATATRLETGRTIALTGDVDGTSVAFDGSANLSFSTTLAATGVSPGTYNSVTVDSKGRVTAGSNVGVGGTITVTGDVSGSGTSSISLTLAATGISSGTYKSVTVDTKGRVTAGSNPTTLSGYGITDAQPLDSDLTAIAELSGTSGLLRKTGAGAWSLDTTSYLTGNQAITLSGDVSGSGTTGIVVSIGDNKVTLGQLAQISTATFLGRTTAATGNVEALTAAQATALLDTATTSLKGLLSASDKTKLDSVSSGASVSSVAASGGSTGMSFTGGPITGSGTLTLTGTLAVANGGTGGSGNNGVTSGGAANTAGTSSTTEYGTAGSGSGGGGPTANGTGYAGGNYGGGGSGGRRNGNNGGTAGPGLLVLFWYPTVPAAVTHRPPRYCQWL